MTKETYIPDNRFASSEPAHTAEVVIASGQNLAALTPVGQLTATGEFVEWDPAANDGSQIATRVTVNAVDASAAAKAVQAYKTGCFNTAQVAWPGGATALQKSLAFVGTPVSHQSAA